MTTVDPKLARFAADLNDAYEKVCADPKHNGFFDLFKKVEIRLFTYDELTAKFWEEGIEFYPKDGE